MDLAELTQYLSDEDSARELLEKMRWPDGPICPHCGVVGEAYKLTAKPDGKAHVRKGVWKCRACRKQFTVTVGTIFEDSHIPLQKWLLAIHLLCASKKGMSAHQLHRMLGLTYKSAWFMAHRLRYAISQEPLSSRLNGTVEVDETYVGGKPHEGYGIKHKRGRGTEKAPVVSLVQRGGGVRSFQVEHVTVKNLRGVMQENIERDSAIMTDDYKSYKWVRKEFGSHDVVTHTTNEYARRDGDRLIHG